MSGITPLIDTLLHQVLGRQGEVSLQRALDQPVKPVAPGQGPRAVVGDTNLDGRPPASPLSDLKRLPQPLDGGRSLPRSETQPSPLGSTQTHFSPAARTIADVLLRFPAPPAVIRPETALIASQETPVASAVATRLEASIRDSGLFYEAHLKRWFQGEGTRQQLLNEPQMQAGPRPLTSLLPSNLVVSPTQNGLSPLVMPAAHPSGKGAMMILPNVPLTFVASEWEGRPGAIPAATMTNLSANPAPSLSALTADKDGAVGAFRASVSDVNGVKEPMVHHPVRDIVHESLQSLVRQQLDMLVIPTIRWEGDVWAGIFMALVINLPGREQGQDGQQQEGEADSGWRSDMQLDVPSLGAFSASLWLYRNILSIDFTTDSTEAYQRLDAGLPALEKRLSALDLQKVQLRARYIEAEDVYGYSV